MRLLTPDEVAALCGYSRKAIYRAIERGELRATKRCSRWRLWPEDVRRWLDEGVREPQNWGPGRRGKSLPAAGLPRGNFRALLANEEDQP